MKWLLAVLFSASLLSGAGKQTGWVWPSPPDEGRIAFDKFITKAEDLRIEKGFFSKIWDFVAGDDDKALSKPFGLHIDSADRIYVTDMGNSMVFVFDPLANSVITIEGTGKSRFVSPVDVDSDRQGKIYVSDSVRAVVDLFDEDGDYLLSFGKGVLQRPTGIVVDETLRRVYVADTTASKIVVFSLGGKLLSSFGKPGAVEGDLNRPTFMALGRGGSLYVVDSMNQRIQVFDREGRFLRKFGQLGNKIGSFANPRGIALDQDENVYVSDTLYNNVQIFDKNGSLLLVLGGYGDREGEFAIPEDIAIGKRGQILIADSLNMRVQALRVLQHTTK